MKVLDHEQDRRVLAERLEQAEQRLEHQRLRGGPEVRVSRETRKEGVEPGAQRWRERVERRMVVADEGAQRA